MIIDDFKTAIKSIVDYVGEYPFDVEKIGANEIAGLVQDGDASSIEVIPNKSIKKSEVISVWLYYMKPTTRIKQLRTLETSVIDAVLDISATDIDCIDWLSTEKGEKQPNIDRYSVGYFDNLSIWKINFEVIRRVAR